MLSDFSHDLPDLVIYGTSVNTNFATQQPAAVKAYIKANLEVNRTIAADHALLLHEAARLLDQDEDSLKPLVDRYFELNAWDQNGGLTAEKVAYNYDFLVSLGDFKVGLTTDQLADLSYLNAVLAEIGRK